MTLRNSVWSKPTETGGQEEARRGKKRQDGTHPHRLTSMTFFQVSKPSSAVALVAIPALLRRTATYSSSTCSLISSPISPKLRQKQNNTQKTTKSTPKRIEHNWDRNAHLSKGLICLILEPLHLLEVAHVRGDHKHILLTDSRRDFAPQDMRILRVDIGENDPEPVSERGCQSTSQSFQSFHHSVDSRSNQGWDGGRWNKDKRATHRANSSAAARPIPDAAPVTTATRPHWKAGCPAGSKGERICVKYRIAAAVARKRTRSGRSDRGMREGLGRLCWVPAAPSRPLYRSALLGTAKRDGSGT